MQPGLPALLALPAFAVALRSRRLGIAAAVFAVSLTARTLDEPLCSSLPLGTHWLWHCLNAVTLYLIAVTVDRLGGRPAVSARRSRPDARRGR